MAGSQADRCGQFGWTGYNRGSISDLRNPVVENVLADLEISLAANEWALVDWRHDQPYIDPSDGESKQPSRAVYRAAYNRNAQVIVIGDMFAPRKGPNGTPPQLLPLLRHWSDVTFVHWVRLWIYAVRKMG